MNILACSNCKAVSNGKHAGHGVANRRCPIFLMKLDKMNKMRSENKYKFYCTSNPKTWETLEANKQEASESALNKTKMSGDTFLNPHSLFDLLDPTSMPQPTSHLTGIILG